MKKIIPILAITAILFSSCSVLSPADPTATPLPAPTSTPDPCSPENVIFEVEELQALVNSFQDGMNIANNTDVTYLVFPIMRLQEIQTEIRKIKVPVCLANLKNISIDYSVSVINYLLIFMNSQDPAAEELAASIQNSQVLWQSVLNEFNTVLTNTGVEQQDLPDLNQLFPQDEGTGAFARNEGTQAVNVRLTPNLNADVVASLEAGMQALALGRVDANDWVQVNLDGVFGWVFAEAVTLSVPIDQLPLVETTP